MAEIINKDDIKDVSIELDSDILNKLDDLDNFKKLQEFLIGCGVPEIMVQACASMEMILKSIKSHKNTEPLKYENGKLFIGDIYIAIDTKASTLDMHYLSSDNIAQRYYMSGGYIVVEKYMGAEEPSNEFRIVPDTGALQYENNYLTNTKRYRYQFVQNDVPVIVEKNADGIYRTYVDQGVPTSVYPVETQKEEDYNQLTERYPNIKLWHDTRWRRNPTIKHDDMVKGYANGNYQLPLEHMQDDMGNDITDIVTLIKESVLRTDSMLIDLQHMLRLTKHDIELKKEIDKTKVELQDYFSLNSFENDNKLKSVLARVQQIESHYAQVLEVEKGTHSKPTVMGKIKEHLKNKLTQHKEQKEDCEEMSTSSDDDVM